ncbi:MAG: 50S ribosomal protein L6 [Candidatus Symbiodolus clandestinus]
MSRIAKVPVTLLPGVSVAFTEKLITITGKLGSLATNLHQAVKVDQYGEELHFSLYEGHARGDKAQLGTARALIYNMVVGVSQGFSRKLQLVGVGYRAQMEGNTIVLHLGFSNPVRHQLPQGITAEIPAAAEILVKGIDKQLVNQVAAVLRGYRSPEPYKGKGVRYANETVRLKEAKKK